MDPLGGNPLAVLTFIVAPAVLTNASSVMGLQTANRFARAIDRARNLTNELRGKDLTSDVETQIKFNQLQFAQRRAQILVRALTSFYLAVGSFAGAAFASLMAAIFVIIQIEILRNITLVIALACGVTGVGGLLTGSGLLVWETRQTLGYLRQEVELLQRSQIQIPPTIEKPKET